MAEYDLKNHQALDIIYNLSWKIKKYVDKSGHIIEILIYTYITNGENCVLCE